MGAHPNDLASDEAIQPDDPSTTRPEFYSIREIAQCLRVGRSTVYSLLGSGVLPAVSIGARRFVHRDDLDAYIASLRAAAAERAAARSA